MAVPGQKIIYPKEEIYINPIIGRNDQRNDIETPFMGVVDWAQCKGNCFQNVMNFIGLKYSDTPLKQFATMDTYLYYNILESYILYTELLAIKGLNEKIAHARKANLIYDWNMHLKCWNKILEPHKLKFVRKNSNIIDIIGFIQEHKTPVILGTWLSATQGHIITVIGIGNGYLICSDPYGVYPYGKESKAIGHNGYKVHYEDELVRKVINKEGTPTSSVYLVTV